MIIPANPKVVARLGRVHVYTGDGKGKTSACMGLALRASGHGLRTYVAQFLKSRPTGEAHAIKKHLSDYITVEQFGGKGFIFPPNCPQLADYELAWKGIDSVREKMYSRKYHIVILDEINTAVFLGLIWVQEVLQLIKTRPHGVEMVLTGRDAHSALIDAADLVTDMRLVKHYFNDGVNARVGIEE